LLDLFLSLQKTAKHVKRYKVHEILTMLKKDDWHLIQQNGSHRQFRHPVKKGRVTLNGKPSKTLEQELLNSIFKQAGWKQC
jgi:predicted RNA binding protein YcfA (HicA-like mRNA interferase family)